MNPKKLFIISIFILAVLLLGAVSAQDTTDAILGNESASIEVDEANLHDLVEDEDYEVYIPQEYPSDELSVISVERMPLDAGGNISISVDDVERYNQKVSVGGNGIFVQDLKLDYGIHNVLINYSGDNNYMGFIKTGSIENSFIHAYIDQYCDRMGHNYVSGSVTLDDGIAGDIRVLLDNKAVISQKYDGSDFISFEYEGHFSTYEIQYFNGNRKDSIKKGSLESSNPEIIIPPILLAGKTYNLTFNSHDGSDGDMILSGLVNGTFKLTKGTATVKIPAQSEGFYSLNITYGNETWDVSFEVKGLVINVYSLEYIYPWTWDDSDGDSGPGIDIYVYSYIEDYQPAGNTSIYLNDKLIDTLQGAFDYLIDEEMLWRDYSGPGNYSVKVCYGGDENFKPANETFIFKLSHYACYCEDGMVHVDLLSDVSGVLTVKVNGKTISTKKVKATYASYASLCAESYEIALSGLKTEENNIVEVEFKDNAGKASFYESFNYTLTCPIDIGFLGEHEIYGEDNCFAFSMPGDIKSNASVTIDGKDYGYTKISQDTERWEYVFDYENINVFEVRIDDLKPGNHSIVVSYPGDSRYSSNSINQSITVQSQVMYLQDYSTGNKVYLNLPSDASGNLTVEIKYLGKGSYNVFKSVALKDGKASVQLPLGVYSFNAYYTGDDYEVEGDGRDICIQPPTDYPSEMSYGQTKQFKLDDCYNATLVFYIGEGKGYRLPVAEFDLNQNKVISIDKALVDAALNTSLGKFLMKSHYRDYGSFYLNLQPVIYSNVGIFDEFYPIEVDFYAKLTGLKAISMQYGTSITISLKVYDIYGKLAGKNQAVKIKIGEKTFTAKTNKNGVVKFKIPNTITPGKYTVTATYKNAKVSKKLTVKRILTVKTVKVKKSAKKLVLTATLKKVNGKYLKGKWIKFKFNGKTYKAKTNKKGIAKVTVKKSVLKKLKVGKTVKYQATYLKDTVKKSAVVKK
ncbi:MAG: hypothetical protein Q4Q14_01040 [Methanobrevibacter sp.]|nr:hypothetical protein [Methanobrevibacter sp.]